MLLVASGLFAMFFFNSLYIQRVLGYGPLKAGLAFLPFTGGIMVSAGHRVAVAAKLGVRLVAGVGIVDHDSRPPLAHADPGTRDVCERRPAADPADVVRHGPRLRRPDARRNDRARRHRPGARIRHLQHVTADRRGARARDPRHHCGEPLDCGGRRRPGSSTDSTGRSRAAPCSWPAGSWCWWGCYGGAMSSASRRLRRPRRS